ncbi:MAG: ATP-binding protein [Christensenellales bacterium]|jgi:serine/threonine-protein kinase RsbT
MRITEKFQVKAMDFSAAGQPSAMVKRKLKQLGIDSSIIRKVSIATYEAEINLVIHSYGGEIECGISPSEIMITVRDEGPGIPDVKEAMREGFSTASDEARDMGFGAGMGLPNMSRNADKFSIESQVGKGTVITMAFELA